MLNSAINELTINTNDAIVMQADVYSENAENNLVVIEELNAIDDEDEIDREEEEEEEESCENSYTSSPSPKGKHKKGKKEKKDKKGEGEGEKGKKDKRGKGEKEKASKEMNVKEVKGSNGIQKHKVGKEIPNGKGIDTSKLKSGKEMRLPEMKLMKGPAAMIPSYVPTSSPSTSDLVKETTSKDHVLKEKKVMDLKGGKGLLFKGLKDKKGKDDNNTASHFLPPSLPTSLPTSSFYIISTQSNIG